MARVPTPERRNLYGRRRGHRLRKGRETLLKAHLPTLAIELPEGDQATFDPASALAFAPTDVWLEIGFGAGEHLSQQARANPTVACIGCEPYTNGVASLVRYVDQERLTNIRIFTDDARLLIHRLPDACLGRVFLLFPDPWPKRRHHKRRFVQPALLDELARVMKGGAEFRLATDHDDYCRWALGHLLDHGAFAWLVRRPADWRTRPADWPETRYERRTRGEGRRSTFLRFARRGEPPR